MLEKFRANVLKMSYRLALHISKSWALTKFMGAQNRPAVLDSEFVMNSDLSGWQGEIKLFLFFSAAPALHTAGAREI